MQSSDFAHGDIARRQPVPRIAAFAWRIRVSSKDGSSIYSRINSTLHGKPTRKGKPMVSDQGWSQRKAKDGIKGHEIYLWPRQVAGTSLQHKKCVGKHWARRELCVS